MFIHDQWPDPADWPPLSKGGVLDVSPPHLEDVLAFLTDATGEPRPGLKKILGMNGFSVSAVFDVSGTGVVFKCNWCPLFQQHPRILRLLNEGMPGATPEVIADRVDGRGAWVLTERISGETIQAAGAPDLIGDAARRMGEIQVAFAALREDRVSELRRFPPRTEMLSFLIDTVERKYLETWLRGGAVLTRNGKTRTFDIPDDFLDRLATLGARVSSWEEELAQEGIPDSIHHTDRHPDNAMVTPEGEIKIIDWNRAVLAFPFDSVYWLVSMSDESPWSLPKSTVRDQYLGVIPWGRPERLADRVWALGRLVANIESAYESEILKQALNYSEDNGSNIAGLLLNALNRWERVN